MAHSHKYRGYWAYENFRKKREKEFKTYQAQHPELNTSHEKEIDEVDSNDLFKDAVSEAVLVPKDTVINSDNHTFTFKDPKTGKMITCSTQGTITFGDGESRPYKI